MTTHFLRSYSKLLIKTCHRRGAFAMGGMAAQIPIKNDPKANEEALAKVRADKEREAGDGHDGTWVAHPGPRADRDGNVRPADADAESAAARRSRTSRSARSDLLQIPQGTITEAGLRNNVSVSIQYIAAWLGGLGCVPINNLMEDAATAEISRAQIWQWIKHPGRQARRRPQGDRRAVPQGHARRARQARRSRRRRRPTRPATTSAPPRSIDRSRPRPTSERSSPCRRTAKSTEQRSNEDSHDDTRCRAASQRLANQPALEGRGAAVQGRGRRAPARHGAHRALARAPGRREALEATCTRSRSSTRSAR